MVKIVELTQKEKEARTRYEALRKIATEAFPSAKILAGISRTCFGVEVEAGENFFVFPANQRIIVDKPNTLENAVRLANTYENKGFQEFTVEKEYE